MILQTPGSGPHQVFSSCCKNASTRAHHRHLRVCPSLLAPEPTCSPVVAAAAKVPSSSSSGSGSKKRASRGFAPANEQSGREQKRGQAEHLVQVSACAYGGRMGVRSMCHKGPA